VKDKVTSYNKEKEWKTKTPIGLPPTIQTPNQQELEINISTIYRVEQQKSNNQQTKHETHQRHLNHHRLKHIACFTIHL